MRGGIRLWEAESHGAFEAMRVLGQRGVCDRGSGGVYCASAGGNEGAGGIGAAFLLTGVLAGPTRLKLESG